MRITTITRPDYDYEDVDGSLETILETDTEKFSMDFGRGEPEDMSLGRDLNDAYHIADALKAAYEAGKRGETLKIVSEAAEE